MIKTIFIISRRTLLLLAEGLLFFLGVFFSLHVEATDVYLTLVERGQGKGMAGHALLIFTDDFVSPIFGRAYTYGVELPQANSLLVMRRPGLNFKPEALPALIYYQRVVIRQNQSLYALKLKLSPAETLRLENLVKADFASPNFSETHRYDLFSENCLSRPIELINEVVTPERRITLDPKLESFHFNLFHFFEAKIRSFEDHIPFQAALGLKDNPLIDGPPLWIPRFSIQQTEHFVENVKPAIVSLAKCEGWHSETTEMIEVLSALTAREQKIQYLYPVKKLMRQSRGCADANQRVSRFLISVHDMLPVSAVGVRHQVNHWADQAVNGEISEK